MLEYVKTVLHRIAALQMGDQPTILVPAEKSQKFEFSPIHFGFMVPRKRIPLTMVSC